MERPDAHRYRARGGHLRGYARATDPAAVLQAFELGWLVDRLRSRRHASHWLQLRRYASAAFCVYLALLCVGVVDILGQRQTADRYKLDSAGALIGSVSPTLADKLTFDAAAQAYQFNQGYVPAANAATVGGANYTASLPVDPRSSGISLTDPSSQITVTLKPQFSSLPGKSEQGRLVYPVLGTNATMVYSPKSNGLKEDIVIPNYQGDSLSFSYTLGLPSGVEARLRPDGSIGIYTGNPALFGNVSTGTDKDKALLDKARQNSPKTNLAFVIPAPVITQNINVVSSQAGIQEGKPAAVFRLKGDELKVTATRLKDASYPLSIDPSLAVATTSDWTGGNDEGSSIDFSVSGQVSRAGLTGGAVSGWGVGNNAQNATDFIYKGYAYRIRRANTNYEPLGNDGSTFTPSSGGMATNAPSYASSSISTFAFYNGYFYAVGGIDKVVNNQPCGGSLQPACTYDFVTNNSVYYSKVNSDGSLSTWQPAGSGGTLALNHSIGGAVAYNGYIYVYNQYNPTAADQGTTQYAKINADGTLGSWASSSTLSSPAANNFSVVTQYNGYIYVAGGTDNGNAVATGAVYYAPLTTSGVGTWQTTNSLAQATTMAAGMAYHGFLYVSGGCTALTGGGCNGTSSTISTLQYAPIYANGSLGTWKTTASLSESNGRIGGSMVANNNYLYVSGGTSCSTAGVSCNPANLEYSDLQYAQIAPAGEPSAFASQTSFNTARYNFATAAYNGYLYVMGGDNGGSTYYQDVQYTKLTSSGTLANPGCGTVWCTTTNMPNKRNFIHAVPYNGYMYLSGGNGTFGNNQEMYYAPINANGTLGGWTSTNSYSGTRVNYGLVQADGYMYIFGGWTGSGNNNDCQFAKINGPGLSGWGSCANISPGDSNMAAVSSGGYIYYMGGSASGAATASGYYAKPNPATGALTSWSPLPDLPTALNYPRASVYDGVLYVVGGSDANGSTKTVYYASLGADGTFTSWHLGAQQMISARVAGGAETYMGYLYAVGSSFGNSVESAPINNGGTGDAVGWNSGTSMTINRQDFVSGVYSGYVYVVGGCSINGSCSGTNTQGSGEYAPINTDGTLGSWTEPGVNLPNRRYLASGGILSGYMYVIAGNDSSGASTNTVYYVKLLDSGGFSSNTCGTGTAWCTDTANPLPLSCHIQDATIYGDAIYVGGGGCNGGVDSDLFYATQNSDGTLAGWTTTAMPYATVWHGELQAVNGYLYYMGGCVESSCTTYRNDVYYAAINDDYSIGSWTPSTPFMIGRRLSSSAVVNGYIYLLGGIGDSTAVSERAPLLSGGGVGQWAAITDISPTRLHGDAVFDGSYLYFIGGYTGTGGTLKTTTYTTLASQPRLAHYSKLFTTDKNTMPVNYFITDTPQSRDSLVGTGYATATTTSPTLSALTSIANADAGAKYPISISGDGVSYYWIYLTIDDTRSATFGGETPTAISYFQLNYHPNPSMRLRGGKTFNDSKLQGLDAP